MKVIVLILLASCVERIALESLLPGTKTSIEFGTTTSILTTHSSCEHITLLLTDSQKMEEEVQAPRGVAVFQVAADNLDSNTTQNHLRETVDQVRKMGQLWHCLALVVVSDDPTFLATFAHLSLRRYALRWSTRVLVLTHLPLSQLGGLQGLLSNRNAMLLLSQKDKTSIRLKLIFLLMEFSRRMTVYVWHPYSSPSSKPLRVATWTQHEGLTVASHMSLFPDKFSMFSSAPTLTVAIDLLPHTTISWVEDSDAPGGRRLHYTGFVNNIVMQLARAMNFTYRYVLPPQRGGGTKLPNGSWTGVLGMVVREVSKRLQCGH